MPKTSAGPRSIARVQIWHAACLAAKGGLKFTEKPAQNYSLKEECDEAGWRN